MEILHRAGALVEFTPVTGRRRTYSIRTPGVTDRAVIRRQVRALGAQYWVPDVMRESLLAGLDGLAGNIGDAEQVEKLRSVIETYYAAVDGVLKKGVKAERLLSEFQEVESLIRRAWQPYAQKFADNEFYLSVHAQEAVRALVVGWVGDDDATLPVGVISGHGGLSEDDMVRIPPEHMNELDWRIAELMYLSGSEEKNSVSPSPGDSGPETSPTARTTPKKTRPRKKTAGASRK